jgi:hypothetical protein
LLKTEVFCLFLKNFIKTTTGVTRKKRMDENTIAKLQTSTGRPCPTVARVASKGALREIPTARPFSIIKSISWPMRLI